ncbi:unnamed protein product [Prorocentrum cordatum]|uniref:Uncharacterized protein n=1 Tax=Prorocentrum cordatum TaxID=2364126 RepID=A0ABN9VQN2_9DINO|nr:unnamed protein product [Polarella glacialis]
MRHPAGEPRAWHGGPARRTSRGPAEELSAAKRAAVARFAGSVDFARTAPSWREGLRDFISAPLGQGPKGASGPAGAVAEPGAELASPELLQQRAVHWVSQSMRLMQDLGCGLASVPPPTVRVDESEARPAMACYRHHDYSITFGWSGQPWREDVVQLVSAHEAWHAAQHLRWGALHGDGQAAHRVCEGSAVLFTAFCACCRGWGPVLPVLLDYLRGKAAQAVAQAHVEEGAWTAEGAAAFAARFSLRCPLGRWSTADEARAYLEGAAVLADALDQDELSPAERLVALLASPLTQAQGGQLLHRICGAVGRAQWDPQAPAWPTDAGAPTARALRLLRDIFCVRRGGAARAGPAPLSLAAGQQARLGGGHTVDRSAAVLQGTAECGGAGEQACDHWVAKRGGAHGARRRVQVQLPRLAPCRR